MAIHGLVVIDAVSPYFRWGDAGRVICFPINAPGMGRFKLFDLVGYS